jgi:multimeric flavodoxin WrbA
MKAIFINGSPRKNKNTAQMLEAAMQGAQHAGAETELIQLYDLHYQGCKSCFACKQKNYDADASEEQETTQQPCTYNQA